jgi:aminopeptidase N
MTVFAQIAPIEPGVSHDLAIWRAARYSDIRYKLNLTLEKMSPVLKGTIEIRVDLGARTLLSASPQGGEIAPIILDWRKIKGSESLSTISNVSINGVSVSPEEPAMRTGVSALHFEESNEHLIFRDGVKAGENVIKLDFTSPILTSGAAVTRYVDKEDGGEYIYSLFVPSDASTAFPVFDQPDLKARFKLTVGVPVRDDGLNWHVISNTPGERSRVGGLYDLHDSRHMDDKAYIFTDFAETKPISTYVFAFAAGDFAEFSDNKSVPPAVAGGLTREPKKVSGNPSLSNADRQPPATAGGTDKKKIAHGTDKALPDQTSEPLTRVYVRRSQAKKFEKEAPEVFRLTREGLKYLEGYFDFKFPFPKYDLVLIPEFPFGGMEHAGATFLREDRIIFPQEPTKNDHITRANVIFHETAHQWFGDTVTMKWFDDLWLKEGFAEFMAYKTLEKVMPEYNAWKVFYERNKQAAYATDSTKGTTPIYQPIDNLSAAKSAYGNIVYRKAPSFLRQAEFYLGEDKFQTAVRAFLKKHAFANAGWEDLVSEFEAASGQDLKEWADVWVKQPGIPVISNDVPIRTREGDFGPPKYTFPTTFRSTDSLRRGTRWRQKTNALIRYDNSDEISPLILCKPGAVFAQLNMCDGLALPNQPKFIFPNYQDHGYGIFLLDDKSRDYVLKNIQNEKDDFLRSMMWGSLWDSVREGELDPKEYVELVVKNIGVESDESTIATLLNRVSVAMNYYMSVPPAVAGG